ncbi:uncharacterized protein LOC123504733 [Portunus trituberculatus]|uniref:uncharacterized protein LOC123504733 n=1 Tax=Portunus trituberculatus TaxID=210409 RepID=UPI001E1CC78F|nr:uncharacterized protein LOC123504733 [Portunus trituberculatus]
MTVEGDRAVRENSRKYSVLKKIARDYAGERVIVMGDMNAHVGMLGEQMSRNGEMLDELVNEMNLENLNETLAEGRVTWCARNQEESAIDYMLVNGRMREVVDRMWIDEEGMIDILRPQHAGARMRWRYKGLTRKKFCVTCTIKMKMSNGGDYTCVCPLLPARPIPLRSAVYT